MTRSGTKGCAERCDSSVPNHREAITTTQNTGSASSFATAPDVPSTSEAPSVTKLPVTCAVNRPCSARNPAVSTKPALRLSSSGSVILDCAGAITCRLQDRLRYAILRAGELPVQSCTASAALTSVTSLRPVCGGGSAPQFFAF